MTDRARVGEFETIVLLALVRLKDNAYGMTIRREIAERTGRDVSIGAVYTTLNRLEKKGYVSSWTGDPTPVRGGRAKRYFKIEASGQIALANGQQAVASMQAALETGWTFRRPAGEIL